MALLSPTPIPHTNLPNNKQYSFGRSSKTIPHALIKSIKIREFFIPSLEENTLPSGPPIAAPIVRKAVIR
jgi:tRNA(Leu) C34 or U34 (ribose-2'-O)-methylase TrmL